MVAEVELMSKSRRLSSTRGLRERKKIISNHYPVTDEDGSAKIVDTEMSGILPRQINWELNEKVSVSSGSSLGIEMRPKKNKGIEFEKRPSLELMNVSVGQVRKKESSANERNWTQARHKLDKTNEAISKRLELIHELNQKILANYDKFQQKTWRKQASWRKCSPKAKDEQKNVPDPNFSLAVKPSFGTTTRISVNYHAENEPRSDSCDLYRQKNQADKLEGHSSSLVSSSALEKKIIRDLNETIDGYDSETKLADSIQSSTPVPKKETTWDETAVAGANGCGWVRVHTGVDSSLIYLTLDTTAKDLCRDMLLTDELSIFIQVGELFFSISTID